MIKYTKNEIKQALENGTKLQITGFDKTKSIEIVNSDFNHEIIEQDKDYRNLDVFPYDKNDEQIGYLPLPYRDFALINHQEMKKIHKIKTLKDASYFLENFSQYANEDSSTFDYRDTSLNSLKGGCSRITQKKDGFYLYNFGSGWEDLEPSKLENPVSYIFNHRKYINKEIAR